MNVTSKNPEGRDFTYIILAVKGIDFELDC
jgi:hypothetical protein